MTRKWLVACGNINLQPISHQITRAFVCHLSAEQKNFVYFSLQNRERTRDETVDALNSVIDKLLEAKTVEQAREVLEEDAQ